MTHEVHSQATEAGVLSADCPDCNQKKLGGLDDEHMVNAIGMSRSELEALIGEYPWLWLALDAVPAIKLQKERLLRTRKTNPEDAVRYEAMMAPLDRAPKLANWSKPTG